MKLTAILAVSALIASGAAAQTSPAIAPDQALPAPTPARYEIGAQAGYDAAVSALAAQGFEVLEYEQGTRRTEVTGLTATGHCLELKFNPKAGKEVRRRREDDCPRQ